MCSAIAGRWAFHIKGSSLTTEASTDATTTTAITSSTTTLGGVTGNNDL